MTCADTTAWEEKKRKKKKENNSERAWQNLSYDWRRGKGCSGHLDSKFARQVETLSVSAQLLHFSFYHANKSEKVPDTRSVGVPCPNWPNVYSWVARFLTLWGIVPLFFFHTLSRIVIHCYYLLKTLTFTWWYELLKPWKHKYCLHKKIQHCQMNKTSFR